MDTVAIVETSRCKVDSLDLVFNYILRVNSKLEGLRLRL